MAEFSGFPKECLPFLVELKANNEREWFNNNKQRYESLVREPALVFIEVMAPKLAEISSHFQAITRKSGGSLMRVYRDTRFSKDKTPYKTNIGIQFRHEQGRDVHAPSFYLHIDPGDSFIGVGIWHPESKALTKIRDFIVDNPVAWQNAIDYQPFRKKLSLVGDSLKQPPRGYPADHELIDDLKRKDFIALKHLDERIINQRQLVDTVCMGFKEAGPLMDYLCAAIEVPY